MGIVAGFDGWRLNFDLRNAESHEFFLFGAIEFRQDFVEAGQGTVDAVGLEGLAVAGFEFLAEVLALD